MPLAGRKRKRNPSKTVGPTPPPRHPYLSGNFAPIQQTLPLTPCTYIGKIPEDLAEGEYVRNGSNPVLNEDLGRDAHWFDGDGMLSGVLFRKDESTGEIKPEFVNQFVLTDLYLNALSSPRLRVPILPSITTLVNPLASILYVTLRILRTVLLVILSYLPGSKQKIRKISVANTSVLYHDGRALAVCESGPPMRIQLPELTTVGWYNGVSAEGEQSMSDGVDGRTSDLQGVEAFGHGSGMIKFMREWTTAHPKIDSNTKEMFLFHSCFAPPYVQYSIIPQTPTYDSDNSGSPSVRLLNVAVPGVKEAKMMHDFGVSSRHTIIMDLPLTLDPTNQLKGLPPVSYDSSTSSRFGVFPRQKPDEIKWYETDACCIFHTANTWDDVDNRGQISAVNMLACRLTSATMIFAAGNISPPVVKPRKKARGRKRRISIFSKQDRTRESPIWDGSPLLEAPREEKDSTISIRSIYEDDDDDEDESYNQEQCRLYYYCFDLHTGSIRRQWAISTLPCEFPSVRSDREMQEARFVYGCSTRATSFAAALGKVTKVDALVKMDVKTLIAKGSARAPRSVSGSVDTRTMVQVLESKDPHDPIQVFCMPEGWFAQEPRFVPASTNLSEDNGYLVFYAFNEAQLDDQGDIPSDSSPSRAKSELWVVDARNMKDLFARVQLPQRVPYGLHGAWFSAEQIEKQRPLDRVRTTALALGEKDWGLWMAVRDWVEKILG